MQTNAIASNSGWFRANSCKTSKHGWILMFTNWTALVDIVDYVDGGLEEHRTLCLANLELATS